MKNTFSNKKLGKFGEDLAVDYLKKSKFEILERNWHCSKDAEVDIIAKDGKTLVFVEVKTRSNLNCGHPFEAINVHKMQKIMLAIPVYIEKNDISCSNYRIDLIAVIGKENPKIEHIRGAGF